MASDWSLSNNLLNIDHQLPKNLLNLDPSAPKESIEALIANFDDIPRLMQKHKAYDPIVVQHLPSHGVRKALNGHEAMSLDSPHSQRLAEHASKVFDHLCREGHISSKKTKDLAEVASIAREALNNLSRETVNRMPEKSLKGLSHIFSPYDTHKRGKITYDDFTTTLTKAGGSINKVEAQQLADHLDVNNTGAIDYNNILAALQRIEESKPIKKLRSRISSDVNKEAEKRAEQSEAYAALTDRVLAALNPYHKIFNSSQTTKPEEKFNTITNIVKLTPRNLEEVSPPNGHVTLDRTKQLSRRKGNLKIELEKRPKTIETEAYSIKRMNEFEEDYLHKVKKSSFSQSNKSDCNPLSIDPSPSELKKKRALSAPPRSRSMTINDALLVTDQWAPSSAGMKGSKNSLQNLLNRREIENKNIDPKDNFRTMSQGMGNPNPIPNPSRDDIAGSGDEGNKFGIIDMESTKARVGDNAVLSQIGGRYLGLRHILNKEDASRSGQLSYNEFRSGIKKCGVYIDEKQMRRLFESGSIKVDPYIGERGCSSTSKVVDINDFVDTMQDKTCSPALSHLSEECNAEKSKQAEEKRIFKKVLHTFNKTSDPLLVFQHLDPGNDGYIDSRHLREGLTLSGVVLSDREFAKFMEKVETSSDGKVALASMDAVLHREVNEYQTKVKEVQADIFRGDSRYNNTFQSSLCLHHHNLEYESILKQSKVAKAKALSFAKLQETIKNKGSEVLAAFSGRDANGNRLTEPDLDLTLPQMVSRLDHAGIALGIDDQTRLVACLSRHMNKRSQNQKVYNNSKNDKNDVFSMKGKQKGSINNFNNDSSSKTCDDNVTINLEQFCVALGVEMITDHKGNIDVCNPRDMTAEGNIFASSHKSQCRNLAIATSYNLEDSKGVGAMHRHAKWATGDRKKHITQPLYEHITQPSKFFELAHSKHSDAYIPDILCNQLKGGSLKELLSQKSCRMLKPPSPNLNAAATHLSLAHHDSSNKVYNDSCYGESDIDGIRRSSDNIKRRVNGGRSSSAPPRLKDISGTNVDSSVDDNRRKTTMQSLKDFAESKRRLCLDRNDHDLNLTNGSRTKAFCSSINGDSGSSDQRRIVSIKKKCGPSDIPGGPFALHY